MSVEIIQAFDNIFDVVAARRRFYRDDMYRLRFYSKEEENKFLAFLKSRGYTNIGDVFTPLEHP